MTKPELGAGQQRHGRRGEHKSDGQSLPYKTRSTKSSLLLIALVAISFLVDGSFGQDYNNDRVVEYDTCYEEMVRNDFNQDKKLDASEYFEFSRRFGGRSECWEEVGELPIELRSSFNQISCECLQRPNADPDCCKGDNANVPIQGASPLDDPSIVEEQLFLEQACLRTDQSIIAFCQPPPVAAIPIPGALTAAGLTSRQLIGLILGLLLLLLLLLLCCCWCCGPAGRKRKTKPEEDKEEPDKEPDVADQPDVETPPAPDADAAAPRALPSPTEPAVVAALASVPPGTDDEPPPEDDQSGEPPDISEEQGVFEELDAPEDQLDDVVDDIESNPEEVYEDEVVDSSGEFVEEVVGEDEPPLDEPDTPVAPLPLIPPPAPMPDSDEDEDRVATADEEEEEDDGQVIRRGHRTIEGGDPEEDGRRGLGEYEITEPEADDAGLKLRPIERPEIEAPDDPYELEHYDPDGGIIDPQREGEWKYEADGGVHSHEREGQWNYDADGGWNPEERGTKAPVEFDRTKYQRGVHEEVDPDDNRKQRRIEGFGDAALFGLLDEDASDEENIEPVNDNMHDWVVPSFLDTLDTVGDKLTGSFLKRRQTPMAV